MQIPFDSRHVLADVVNLWRGQVPHEDDFKAFGAMCGSEGAMRLLDCGANVGQSTASLLMNCPHGHLISFEPNPLYEPVLAGLRDELGAERFDFAIEGLSDHDETMDLHVPFVDGRPYLQEAAMDLRQFDKPGVGERLRSYGSYIQFESFPARFVTGDSKRLDIDVVKIDAEGSELWVLFDMLQTIRRCQPVLLVENNDWHEVTSFLGGLGYCCYRWEAELGKPVPMYGASTNSFYFLEKHGARFGAQLIQA